MKYIPNVVAKNLGRQLLIAQKHSPRILFGAGVTGVVVSAVLACKATLKLNEVLDVIEDEVQGVKEHLSDRDDNRKDLVYIYAKGAYEVTKLYAVPVTLGSVSIAAITGSHVILTRRNAGLTAAYAMATKTFEDYRERVKKELGEDKEYDINHDATTIKVKVDGKMEEVRVNGSAGMYAKSFNEQNRNWHNDRDSNRMFIQGQERFLNQRLHERGHMFLNEVYEALGFEHTPAGQIVGWLSNGDGDCYIDFGLYSAAGKAFLYEDALSLTLDFNVDGPMYHLI